MLQRFLMGALAAAVTAAPATAQDAYVVGVTAAQLWHHLYIDGSLCELPMVGR